MPTKKDRLNRANANDLPVALSELQDTADPPLGVGDMLESMAPTGWDTGIAVSTNVATLAQAGMVVAVEATTATAAGPKQQIQSGSPAAGQVDVAYDADGIPTLTFNGTDAVTEAAVQQLKAPSGVATLLAESLNP